MAGLVFGHVGAALRCGVVLQCVWLSIGAARGSRRPNVLVGVTKGLGNLRPTIFDHHALWTVEEPFWRGRPSGAAR